jgi:hypothetical protein
MTTMSATSAAFEQFRCECAQARAATDPPQPVPDGAVKVLVRDSTAYFALSDKDMFAVTYWANRPPLVRPVPADWVRWLCDHYKFTWPAHAVR